MTDSLISGLLTSRTVRQRCCFKPLDLWRFVIAAIGNPYSGQTQCSGSHSLSLNPLCDFGKAASLWTCHSSLLMG